MDGLAHMRAGSDEAFADTKHLRILSAATVGGACERPVGRPLVHCVSDTVCTHVSFNGSRDTCSLQVLGTAVLTYMYDFLHVGMILL